MINLKLVAGGALLSLLALPGHATVIDFTNTNCKSAGVPCVIPQTYGDTDDVDVSHRIIQKSNGHTVGIGLFEYKTVGYGDLTHVVYGGYDAYNYLSEITLTAKPGRLLSLQSAFDTFEGGAHPNHSYDALLWDRVLGREIAIGDQFLHASSFAALTRGPYCKALAREQSKRRDGEKLDLREFNECPKYSDLAIAPVDKNKDGRFDRLGFIASPYVAGPYAEGEYEIELPVTSQLIAAMKSTYRSSYEAQRQ